MDLHIHIDKKVAVFLLIGVSLISAVGLVVAYGTSSPSSFGHSWGEIACSGCITGSNIASGAVRSSDLADGSVTDPKVSGIDWSKITTGVPSGLSDGDQVGARTSDCTTFTIGNDICIWRDCPAGYVMVGINPCSGSWGTVHHVKCCRIG